MDLRRKPKFAAGGQQSNPQNSSDSFRRCRGKSVMSFSYRKRDPAMRPELVVPLALVQHMLRHAKQPTAKAKDKTIADLTNIAFATTSREYENTGTSCFGTTDSESIPDVGAHPVFAALRDPQSERDKKTSLDEIRTNAYLLHSIYSSKRCSDRGARRTLSTRLKSTSSFGALRDQQSERVKKTSLAETRTHACLHHYIS